MTMESSLVFIKPGNKHLAIEIIEFLEDKLKCSGKFGRCRYIDIPHVPREIIEEHYKHILENKDIPEETKRATIRPFLEQGVILAVYAGENIAERIRNIVGETDPQKAGEDTIRGVFSFDSLKKASQEKRYLNNVIHASAPSLENREALAEIRLWSDFLYDSEF